MQNWISWVAKKLALPLAWRIVLFLAKDHPVWVSLGAAMSGVLAYLVDLGWVIWFFGAMSLFALIMGIRQTWFPQGFRKKRSQEIKREPVNESGNRPTILPVRYGRNDRDYEGLLLINDGTGPALDVVVEPLQMGDNPIRFTGAEVTYLKGGDTCFFSLGNSPPALLLRDWKGSSIFMGILRKWQKSLGDDWGASVEGLITYKDVDGSECETRYQIGADVLNDSGLFVKTIKTGYKLNGNP